MRSASLLLAVLLVCPALGASADAPPARDRARTYLMLRVVDALDLSDDKALQMREILHRADDRRLELTKKRDALDAEMRTALAHSPVDGPKLETLVGDAHQVQRDLAALPENTFTEAQRILTVEQQAKLLLFRRDLQGEVRQAIRRRPPPAAHRPK
jgi:hypothetical protein